MVYFEVVVAAHADATIDEIKCIAECLGFAEALHPDTQVEEL